MKQRPLSWIKMHNCDYFNQFKSPLNIWPMVRLTCISFGLIKSLAGYLVQVGRSTTIFRLDDHNRHVGRPLRGLGDWRIRVGRPLTTFFFAHYFLSKSNGVDRTRHHLNNLHHLGPSSLFFIVTYECIFFRSPDLVYIQYICLYLYPLMTEYLCREKDLDIDFDRWVYEESCKYSL